MNSTALIILIALGLGVVVLDVVVRLILLPNRQDKLIGQLLDQLMESSLEAESFPKPPAVVDLNTSLLAHFESSAISRQILGTLADAKGLTQKDLLLNVNQEFVDMGKPPVPLMVVRRVAMILVEAGLVGVEQGLLRNTELGQHLNLLLHERAQARRTAAN